MPDPNRSRVDVAQLRYAEAFEALILDDPPVGRAEQIGCGAALLTIGSMFYLTAAGIPFTIEIQLAALAAVKSALDGLAGGPPASVPMLGLYVGDGDA